MATKNYLFILFMFSSSAIMAGDDHNDQNPSTLRNRKSPLSSQKRSIKMMEEISPLSAAAAAAAASASSAAGAALFTPTNSSHQAAAASLPLASEQSSTDTWENWMEGF